MGINLTQPSMSAGEISPSLYARADLETARIGLSQAQNWFVNYQGGLKRRSGFKLIGQAGSNDTVVLIPFQFSTIQTYMLEFGDKYVRFIANGAYVEDGGSPLELVTPYLAADLERLTYTQSADVLTLFHKAYKTAEIRRLTATTFELVDFENSLGPFETLNIDDSESIYTSDQDGVVDVVANFDAFNDNVVGKLLYLNQETSGEVTTWIQRMSVAVGDKTYYAGNYYEAVQADVNKGDPAQTGDEPPVHTEGEFWDGPGEEVNDDNRDAIIGVLWRYLHSGFGIVRIDSYSDPQNAIGTVIKTIPETVVGGTSSEITWSYPGETTTKVFSIATPPAESSFVTDFEVTVAGTVLTYPAEYVINFTTSEVTLINEPQTYNGGNPADVDIVQQASERETYQWAFEPWRDDSGYPQCGTYYQQRLSVAASLYLPQTIWMSRTDSFNDFSTNRPVLADDTMRFDVNSLQVNEIYHVAPLNALLAFTAGGVWSINQGSNDVISPESPPAVRIQSYDGANPLRPIITGSTGLYVQDGGQIVRDIGFDFSNDAFVGTDLTVRSAHLFEGKEIVSWAYTKNPNKTIWVVFDDGSFAVLTYMREQAIWGWCPCSTDGLVKNVASIREGNEDVLYAVIQRDGVNCVERMNEWFQDDIRDRFFVDSGLTYDGRAPDGVTMTITCEDEYIYPNECVLTASESYFDAEMVGRTIVFEGEFGKTSVLISEFTSDVQVAGIIQSVVPEEIRDQSTADWGLGATSLSGLDHLEGKTVSVLSDGADSGDIVVVDGKIDIQSPGVVIHAGLPYSSVARTLDVELAAPPETTRQRRKVINKVFAYVRSSMGLKAGASLDSLFESESRYDEDYGLPPNRKTELIEINTTDSWNRQGRIYMVQDRPVLTEILSINPEVSVSER